MYKKNHQALTRLLDKSFFLQKLGPIKAIPDRARIDIDKVPSAIVNS